MNKCAGLAGWIFGHKYIKKKNVWIYESDACFRCGKVKGT